MIVPDAGMLPWFERLSDAVPDLEPLDAHTHIGANDPDGYRCSREQLVDALERIDARAFVFPMHEPDGYRAANDMVHRRGGRVGRAPVPVLPARPARRRRSPRPSARSTAARAASSSTRAPSTSRSTTRRSSGVFALADERRLPVLVHAGRGIPALGRARPGGLRRHPRRCG